MTNIKQKINTSKNPKLYLSSFLFFKYCFMHLISKSGPETHHQKKDLFFLKAKFLGNQVLEVLSIAAFSQFPGSL